MQAFAYASPSSLKEALALLGDRWGQADVLAGGTDLLGLMKDHIHTPERVVNIKGIKELGGIPLADDLEEVVHGKLVPLPDNGKVNIKGGEKFVSHVKDSGSS